ncbi:MAG: YwiC-like family protein [Planctomycetes bacterium]|nr:YwiC-like family protein [Planctomycetota bacterium]
MESMVTDPKESPLSSTPAVRLPREDGAWYMALTCWVVGWGASLKITWEPLVMGLAVVTLFAAAQAIRVARRAWTHDRPAARRVLVPLPALLVPPLAALIVLLWRVSDPWWSAALIAPAILYAPLVVAGEERRAAARVLAVVAITGLAPATYLVVPDASSAKAGALWASLGGYYLLGSLFVMARLRRTSSATMSLALVRFLAPAAAVGVAFWDAGHWILSLPFVMLSIRAWVHSRKAASVDPRHVGRCELAYGVTAGVLILIGLWFDSLCSLTTRWVGR